MANRSNDEYLLFNNGVDRVALAHDGRTLRHRNNEDVEVFLGPANRSLLWANSPQTAAAFVRMFFAHPHGPAAGDDLYAARAFLSQDPTGPRLTSAASSTFAGTTSV